MNKKRLFIYPSTVLNVATVFVDKTDSAVDGLVCCLGDLNTYALSEAVL